MNIPNDDAMNFMVKVSFVLVKLYLSIQNLFEAKKYSSILLFCTQKINSELSEIRNLSGVVYVFET